MDYVLDILQGAGLALACGVHPFLPVLLAGGLASADLGLDFEGTTFAFLEEPWFLLLVTVALVASILLRGRLQTGPAQSALIGIAIGFGALLCAASLDDRVGRLVARPARRRGLRRAGRRGHAHDPGPRPAGAWTPRPPRALPLYAGGCVPPHRRAVGRPAPARAARHRLLRAPAGRRPPPRGREVRRASHPQVAVARPPKLVLAVVDGLKPSMLERAVADRSRAGAEGRHGARDLRRRLLRGVPVRHAGLRGDDRDRHAAGPPPDPLDELVQPRGGALRRVRLELQRARGASASSSSSTDTIYNMNLEHLPTDVPTVFETLDDARRAHGRARRTSSTAAATATRSRARRALTRLASTRRAPAGHGPARALLRRPVRQPRTRAAARSSACRGSATSTPAASAPTSSSTTSSTSCCCRCPTTTRTRTPTARTRRSPRSPTADRQLERLMHAGGGTDAFLDEHAVIVVADHSHAPVEQRIELGRRVRGLARAGAERRPTARTPRSRCAPRSARRWSTCCCRRRGGDRPADRRHARWRIEGVDLVMWRPAPRRGRHRAPHAGRRPASCASRPAATCATSAARAGRCRAT